MFQSDKFDRDSTRNPATAIRYCNTIKRYLPFVSTVIIENHTFLGQNGRNEAQSIADHRCPSVDPESHPQVHHSLGPTAHIITW